MKNCIQATIKSAGGTLAVASNIGVSAPTVSQWITGVRPVPEKRVIDISRATDWRVTPHELRPDIYPHPDDGLPEHLRGRSKGEAA